MDKDQKDQSEMTADEYRKATVPGGELPVEQHNISSDHHGH